MIDYDEEYLMNGNELLFSFFEEGYVAVVPKEFWESQGYMYDSPVYSVQSMLEAYDMYEEEEWMYSYDRSEQETRDILVNLGLQESEDFTDWLKERM